MACLRKLRCFFSFCAEVLPLDAVLPVQACLACLACPCAHTWPLLLPPCRKEELLLEEKESSNIELNMGLLKACKDERKLFCKDVQPGQARVFRCLAENVNDADFGSACKNVVVNKLRRRCVAAAPRTSRPLRAGGGGGEGLCNLSASLRTHGPLWAGGGACYRGQALFRPQSCV